MLKEYSEHYAAASSIFERFGNTLLGIQFDEEKEAVEVFVLQSIAMCREHCRSITLLLDNNFFCEPIMVSRSIFEFLFNIHWIVGANDRQEQLRRVRQLEAEPYRHFDDEVKRIEKDAASSTPHWAVTSSSRMREAVNKVKKESPFLLANRSNLSSHFLHAPSLTTRMGNVLRLQYYHLYCFGSMFTHPTPALKELYLRRSDASEPVNAKIEPALEQNLAYGLLLAELILNFAAPVFSSYNPEKVRERVSCYEQLVDIVEKANKGYFGSPRHSRYET